MPTEFRPHRDVLARDFEGKLVLLHLGSGEYFALNGIGSAVWSEIVARAADSGATSRELVQRVCAAYEVSESEAARDVEELLVALAASGLVDARERAA